VLENSELVGSIWFVTPDVQKGDSRRQILECLVPVHYRFPSGENSIRLEPVDLAEMRQYVQLSLLILTKG